MSRTTAAEARSEIVSTSARLFAEKGYEAASIQDIATALGGSKATVLYHFRTKAMILRELMTPTSLALADLLDRIEGLDSSQRRRTAALGFVEAAMRFRDELASYPAAIRRITEIPELGDLRFAELGERLRDALTGGSTEPADLAAVTAMVNGILAAAQALSEHDAAQMHAALDTVALRTLGLFRP